MRPTLQHRHVQMTVEPVSPLYGHEGMRRVNSFPSRSLAPVAMRARKDDPCLHREFAGTHSGVQALAATMTRQELDSTQTRSPLLGKSGYVMMPASVPLLSPVRVRSGSSSLMHRVAVAKLNLSQMSSDPDAAPPSSQLPAAPYQPKASIVSIANPSCSYSVFKLDDSALDALSGWSAAAVHTHTHTIPSPLKHKLKRASGGTGAATCPLATTNPADVGGSTKPTAAEELHPHAVGPVGGGDTPFKGWDTQTPVTSRTEHVIPSVGVFDVTPRADPPSPLPRLSPSPSHAHIMFVGEGAGASAGVGGHAGAVRFTAAAGIGAAAGTGAAKCGAAGAAFGVSDTIPAAAVVSHPHSHTRTPASLSVLLPASVQQRPSMAPRPSPATSTSAPLAHVAARTPAHASPAHALAVGSLGASHSLLLAYSLPSPSHTHSQPSLPSLPWMQPPLPLQSFAPSPGPAPAPVHARSAPHSPAHVRPVPQSPSHAYAPAHAPRQHVVFDLSPSQPTPSSPVNTSPKRQPKMGARSELLRILPPSLAHPAKAVAVATLGPDVISPAKLLFAQPRAEGLFKWGTA